MNHKKSSSPDGELGAGTQNRRAMLKSALLGGGAAVASLLGGSLAGAAPTRKEQEAQEKADRATRGMPAPHIQDVSVIEVGGGGNNDSTIVKVTTDQAGLYGYGCATATFPGGRSKLVKTAVEQYLKPLVTGRTTDRIEQIWQLCYMSSYYKNDVVQNLRHWRPLRRAVGHQRPASGNASSTTLVGGKCRATPRKFTCTFSWPRKIRIRS